MKVYKDARWPNVPRIPGVEGVVGFEFPQTDPPLVVPPQTLESPEAVDGKRPLPQVSFEEDCCLNNT